MGLRLNRLSVFLVLLPLIFLTLPGLSADNDASTQKQIKSWEAQIAKIEKRVDSQRTGTLEEQGLRAELKSITDAAAEVRESALAQARQSTMLLNALGPAPAEDTGPESKDVQKQRKDLEQDVTAHEGRAKQAGLIIARANQVVTKIAALSRERLKAALFERTVTPLNSNAWAIAAPEAQTLLTSSFVDAPLDWWHALQNDATQSQAVLRNFAIAFVTALVGWLLATWLRKRYGRTHSEDQPNHARRLLAGLVEGGGRAFAPVILVALFGGLLFEQGLITPAIESLADTLIGNLVLFFFGYALINAGLTPRREEWHLLEFGPEASHLLSLRLKLVLIVFLILDGIDRATSWAAPSAELSAIAAFIFTLVLVPLLIWLMDSRIWGAATPVADEQAAPSPEPPSMPPMIRLRPIVTLALIGLPIVAVLGYPALAVFVLRALIMSALVLAGLGLLRSVARESLALSFDEHGSIGRFVRGLFALKHESGQRAVFWLNVIVDLVLIGIAVMALLSVWGLGGEGAAVRLGKLMRGIEIGSYTLSMVDIAVGLALFFAIIFLTRVVQKGLERHILPNLTRDKGIQAALKTGIGYVGTIIALLAAVAALGLDLTNLALIAGALSVGLGFGLQNVVNNFVSGLILLAERPIKPGDWVVVGGHEGTVKKVNVRSTEVETFQRASVIIPNADLIATPVMNWTHKNILGRVEVGVGVAYGTDPNKVKEILLDCAKDHANIISHPPPYVLFTDFADSSLNFELRAYLADVEKRLHTGSDLRFAIDAAFKEHGIEIPFPQRVVHMAGITPPPPSQPDEDA